MVLENKLGINSSSELANAEEKINTQIYQTQDLTEQLIQAIPQALNGGTPKEEIASFTLPVSSSSLCSRRLLRKPLL